MIHDKRLIAFGCSHTFGEALFDNHPKNENPSQYAWRNILANKLNLKCLNLAERGSSNIRMWYRASNFSWEDSDIAIFMWTYPERTQFFELEKTQERLALTYTRALIPHFGHHTIRPDINTKFSNAYYKNYYFEYHHYLQLYLYANHIKYYLDNKKIKNYHLFYSDKCVIDFVKYESWNLIWNNLNIIPLYFGHSDLLVGDLSIECACESCKSKALDGRHQGIKAHSLFAKELLILI